MHNLITSYTILSSCRSRKQATRAHKLIEEYVHVIIDQLIKIIESNIEDNFDELLLKMNKSPNSNIHTDENHLIVKYNKYFTIKFELGEIKSIFRQNRLNLLMS